MDHAESPVVPHAARPVGYLAGAAEVTAALMSDAGLAKHAEALAIAPDWP